MADVIAIKRGLLGPEHDRAFWRAKAQRRVQALEAELSELKQILAAELRETGERVDG